MKINKKTIKILSALSVCLFTMIVASGCSCSCSCTSSMCSEQDIKNIKTAIEKKNIEEWRSTAALGKIKVEHEDYVAYANAKVEEIYLTTDCGKSGTCSSEEIIQIKADIKNDNNNKWLNDLEQLSPEDEGYVKTRTDTFQTYVDEQVEILYEKHPKACLVVTDDTDPSTGAKLEAKSWKDAWSTETGLLDGLIVYPISWLLSVITNGLGETGAAALFAIFVVVLIIRVLMLLLNFKGQISTIKMQGIQGEVSAINSRLQDPNISQSEKQALQMKMMDIYRKNDIHPFASLFSQFISFPIFIAVWAAMNQTLSIRKGNLLHLEFGEAINTQIFSGNISAIVLFVLMIAGQICTMKLSSWIKLAKEKKKPNYKKAAKSDSEKQMNTMMFLMIGMVIMSGFLLPAALVIYWFIGSLFSMLQTWAFSTDFVTSKLKSLANRKKKAKVVK